MFQNKGGANITPCTKLKTIIMMKKMKLIIRGKNVKQILKLIIFREIKQRKMDDI